MADSVIKDVGEEVLAIGAVVGTFVSSLLARRTSTIRDLQREVMDLRRETEDQYDQIKELMDENLQLLADRSEHDES